MEGHPAVMAPRGQDQTYHVVQVQLQGQPHGGSLPASSGYHNMSMPTKQLYPTTSGSAMTTTQSHVSPMDTSPPGYISMASLTKGTDMLITPSSDAGGDMLVEQNAAFVHSDGSDMGSPHKSPNKGFTSDGSPNKTPTSGKRRSLTGKLLLLLIFVSLSWGLVSSKVTVVFASVIL